MGYGTWGLRQIRADASLLRVVSAGLESLFQSRPRMGREWLLEEWKNPNNKTGGVILDAEDSEMEIGGPTYTCVDADFRIGQASFILKRFPFMDIWQKLTMTPSYDYERSVVSKEEAEKLAASAFTRGRPISHVSNFAIAHAKKIIDEAWRS